MNNTTIINDWIKFQTNMWSGNILIVPKYNIHFISKYLHSKYEKQKKIV